MNMMNELRKLFPQKKVNCVSSAKTMRKINCISFRGKHRANDELKNNSM